MLQNQLPNSRKRITWVDVLKFLSIFMVICIHCSDPFNVSPEARSNPDFNFWGGIYGSFLRPCVPLFVMITGLLLLPIKMSFEDFYIKRLTRVLVPFVIWSVLYNIFPWITGVIGLPPAVLSDIFAYASPDSSQSLTDAIKNILLVPLNFNVYTIHLWYIYMLIGLYLYMPIISAWIEKASAKHKRIFLYIWACTLFIPYINTFFSDKIFGVCSWNSFGTLYYFAGFNGYLILGNYLTQNTNPLKWKKVLAISIPLFIIGYIVTYMGFKAMTANSNCSEEEMELFFLYCSPNVAMMTIAVFLIVRNIKINSGKIINLFSNIAKCGLGIYFVHYFIVGIGYKLSDIFQIPIQFKIPATAVIVFLISWSIVSCIYRIMPKTSKWIFG